MRRCRAAIRRLIALACLMATPFVHDTLAGAEPPAEPRPTVRRVFVPADAIDSVLPLTGPLLEISGEELQTLFDGAANDGAALPAAWVRSAVHRVVESPSRRRLAGVSRLEVERLPSATTSALLSLSPMNVQIESAEWVDRPDDTVAIGYWHGADSQPVLGVAAPRSGSLEIAWSADAKTMADPRGNAFTDYELSLPKATEAVLELQLPEGREPTLTGAARRDANNDQQASVAWRFALAPADTYKLRVAEGNALAKRPACRWDCHSRFTVDRGGVHGEHRLRARFAGAMEGVAELAVRGDARITGLEHSPSGAVDARLPHGPTSAKLRLNAGARSTFVCRTVSPLVLGQPLELPAVLVSGGEWLEGSTELELAEGLRLVDLQAKNATPQAASPSPTDGAGPAVTAVHHSPSARLSVVIESEAPAFATRSVSRVDLGSIESSGTLVSEVTASSGPLFEIEGSLTPGWVVESVETDPPGRLQSWQSTDGRLRLVLSEPLDAGGAVKVRADGRLPAAPDFASPSARDLRLCEWGNNQSRAHALIVDRDRELLPDDAALLEKALVTEQSYADSFGSIEPISPGQQAVDLSVLPANQPLLLGAAAPAYSVESVLRIECGDDYRYSFRCEATPQRGSLSGLVFRFQRPLPEDARFYLESDGERIEAAPSVAEDAQGTPAYTLRIPADLPAPYTLRIEFREDIETHDACNPIRFPTAASEQCWVAVHAPAGSVVVRPGGGVAAPVPYADAKEPSDGPPLVAAFRLPPRWVWDPRALPVIVPAENATAAVGAIPLESAVVERRLVVLPEGRVVHTVLCLVQPGEVQSSEFQLPQDASDAWAQIGEGPRQPINSAGRISAAEFSLPEGETRRTVSFGYETRSPAGWGGIRLSPERVVGLSAVGKQRVVAWAPPGYSACLASAVPSGHSAWSRIAGPFGIGRHAHSDAADLRGQPSGYPGWTPYEFAFVGEPGPIHFYRNAEAMTPRWVVGLVVAAAATAFLRRSARARAALVLAAAAALAFCPPGWLWLAHPLFFGSLLGTACVCWANPVGLSSQSAEAIRGQATAVCVLVLACCAASECRSAETVLQNDTSARPPVVVLPYDGDYQLGAPLASESALRLLAGNASVHRADRSGYVLLNAEYTGDAKTGDWRCVWDIYCKEPSGRVELPISRQDAEWSSTALVAGVAQQVQWNPDGNRCRLRMPGPGRYRVELTCRIAREPADRPDRFRFAAPPAPKAVVRITGLAPGEVVRFSVTGLAHEADEAGSVTLQAAHAERVEVVFDDMPPQATDDQANPRTVLCWLRVGRERVLLEVFQSTETCNTAAETVLRTPHSYRKVSGVEEADGVTVFASDRRSGVGSVYQPELFWEGAAPSDVRWAVSVDEGLEQSLRLPVGSQEVQPEAFASAWPGELAPPDAAFTTSDPDEPWRISVAPEPAEFAAEQSASLVFDSASVGIEYSAEVTDLKGGVVLHKLAVDPSFEVRAAWVQLQGSEDRVPLRTTRPSPGIVDAFLPSVLRQPHTLRVEGRATPEGGRLELPGVALRDDPPGSHRLSLAHTKRVRLDCSGVGVPLELESAVTTKGDEPIPLGEVEWSSESDPSLGHVVAQEYRSRFQAVAILSVTEDEAGDRLTLDGVVTASDGPLEWIALEPPAVWRRLRLTWDGLPDAEPLPRGSTLVLRLPEPLESGRARSFRITAESDELSAGGLLARFPGAADEQAFVRVSSEQPSLQRAASTRGARAALPELLAKQVAEDPDNHVFRLDAGAPRQQVLPRDDQRIAAQVGPTLIEAAIDSTGSALARARVLVTSADADGLQLRLPEGAVLQRLEVGGVRAPKTADWTTRIRVDIRPQGLPRLVEAWYRLPQGAKNLEAPQWYQNQSRVPDAGFYWTVTRAGEPLPEAPPAINPPGGLQDEAFQNDWASAAQQESARQMLLPSEYRAWQQETRLPDTEQEGLAGVFGTVEGRLRFATALPRVEVLAQSPGGFVTDGRALFVLIIACAAWLHARFRWTDTRLAAAFLPGLLALSVAALAALPLSTAEALLAACAALCVAVQLAAAGPPRSRAASAVAHPAPPQSGVGQSRA